VVIRSHFSSFIYSNEIEIENTNYKFSIYFPSIPPHQCCHISKSLSSLERKREKEKRYRLWDMATLVRGNRGEINYIRTLNKRYATKNSRSEYNKSAYSYKYCHLWARNRNHRLQGNRNHLVIGLNRTKLQWLRLFVSLILR
jgi:hypothetical protein